MITAHTDGWTQRQTQDTTIPRSQNWPRVTGTEMNMSFCQNIYHSLIKMTTSSVGSDENFIKMTFLFQRVIISFFIDINGV